MGLGLLITAFAADVPAVQAAGQCIFLPMILVGGVGIPLVALPRWAQVASGFMPGRYAVDLLQRAYAAPEGLSRAGFSAVAVAVIGIAAAAVALGLLSWESPRRLAPAAWGWLSAAFAAWVVVGGAAAWSGRLVVTPGALGDFERISGPEIAAIRFDNLPGDSEFVSRLSRPLAGGGDGRTRQLALDVAEWSPGRTGDAVQDARNLLCIAAIADVSRDQHEGQAARVVFDRLRDTQSSPRLQKILARIILDPDGGTVVTSAPELGLEGRFSEKIVRQRVDLYARKLLGRLRGRIPD
jgi:ABC-2 type transport system permease protein